jgi:two-component system response regulator FixJ
VIIVDDDEGVRDSTSVLLGLAGHKVQTFPSGSALVEAGIPEGADVILLDLMMPGLNGLETLRALGTGPLPSVIVLTGHGDIPLAVEAMKLGASDFLEKPYPSERLLDLVSTIEPRPGVPGDDAARVAAQEKIERLTPRQREILKGLADGEQSKVTAHRLDLSVRTVEAYRGQLFSRLGVRRMADAVRIAVLAGLSDN